MKKLPSIKFKDWLCESDERDRLFYYASETPLNVGDEIKKWNTSSGRPEIQRAEEIFEQVRKQLVPNAPSRIGCVFVSAGVSWHNKTLRPYLYRVKVSGQTFTVDSGWFGEATYSLQQKDEEAAAEYAKKYWSRKPYTGKYLSSETIVQGKVAVVEDLSATKRN